MAAKRVVECAPEKINSSTVDLDDVTSVARVKLMNATAETR